MSYKEALRYQVSEEFKNNCKSNVGINRTGRIHIVEDDIDITDEDNLVSFTVEDNCYVNDKFIGTTVAKKVTVNIINPENSIDLENKEIEVYAGVEHRKEVTKTGTNVILESDLEIPIDITVKGKSVQSGTPTPETPVEIKSVGDDINLFDGEFEIGSISSNGEEVDDNNCIRSKNLIEVELGTKYSFLADSKLFSKVYIYEYKEDGSYNNSARNIPIDIRWQAKEGTKYIRIKSGTTFTDTSVKVKIQKDTKATIYSEYGKGTVEICQIGKNYWNNDLVENTSNLVKLELLLKIV